MPCDIIIGLIFMGWIRTHFCCGLKNEILILFVAKKVLDMLPSANAPNNIDAGSSCTNSGRKTLVSISIEFIHDTFKEILKSLRGFDITQPKKRKTKIKIALEMSVEGQVTPDKSEPVEEQGWIMADLDQIEQGPSYGKPKSCSDLLKRQKRN